MQISLIGNTKRQFVGRAQTADCTVDKKLNTARQGNLPKIQLYRLVEQRISDFDNTVCLRVPYDCHNKR